MKTVSVEIKTPKKFQIPEGEIRSTPNPFKCKSSIVADSNNCGDTDCEECLFSGKNRQALIDFVIQHSKG